MYYVENLMSNNKDIGKMYFICQKDNRHHVVGFIEVYDDGKFSEITPFEATVYENYHPDYLRLPHFKFFLVHEFKVIKIKQ